MPELTPERAKERGDSFNASVLVAAKQDAAAFRAAAEKSALAEVERVRVAALKEAADISDRYEAAIKQAAQSASSSYKQGLQNALALKSLDADGLEAKLGKEASGQISELKKAARGALQRGAPPWMVPVFGQCGKFHHQCDFPSPHGDPDSGIDNVD